MLRNEIDTAGIGVAALELNGRTIHLIDMPGFDDIYRSDVDVLKEIASFLSLAYHKRKILAGIIYLHPNDQTRMSASMLKNFRLFEAKVGENHLSREKLATSKWNIGQTEILERREKEIHTEFWQPLLEKGCKMLRLSNHRTASNRAEALRVLDFSMRSLDFFGPSESADVVVEDNRNLQIQQELVDGSKMLSQTAAGLILLMNVRETQTSFKEILEEETASDSTFPDSELLSMVKEN